MIFRSRQRLLSFLFVFFIILLGIIFYFHRKNLLPVWFISLGIGYTLNRSGICLSSAYTDVILFKNFRSTRALIVTVMISLLGISALQSVALSKNLDLPGRIAPFGIHTLAGAFLFGLGMVLAGACPSGTLQKIGEGFVLYIIVLIAIIVGSVFGAYHFQWWHRSFPNSESIFLPKILGWEKGLLISVAALILIFMLTLLADITIGKERLDGRKQNRSNRRDMPPSPVNHAKRINKVEAKR